MSKLTEAQQTIAEMQEKIAELVAASQAALELVSIVTAERDALAAQVGAFAAMIIEVRSADESKDFLGSDWHERSDGLMVSIPEQHLAAHDAEVAKAAIKYALVEYSILTNDEVDSLCERYADQIRAKAK